MDADVSKWYTKVCCNCTNYGSLIEAWKGICLCPLSERSDQFVSRLDQPCSCFSPKEWKGLNLPDKQRSGNEVVVASIDPGETVGWAIWQDGIMLKQGQDPFIQFLDNFEGAIGELDHIVLEEYRLRESSSKAMIGDEFITSQVIGVIKWFARKNNVKVHLQSPAQKDWWTNEKLKLTGYYVRGQQHSRDAIRHGLYWWYIGGGKEYCPLGIEELFGDENN